MWQKAISGLNTPANKKGIEPNSWLEIVRKYYPKAFENPKPIDKERRFQAGFSADEIAQIELLATKK